MKSRLIDSWKRDLFSPFITAKSIRSGVFSTAASQYVGSSVESEISDDFSIICNRVLPLGDILFDLRKLCFALCVSPATRNLFLNGVD